MENVTKEEFADAMLRELLGVTEFDTLNYDSIFILFENFDMVRKETFITIKENNEYRNRLYYLAYIRNKIHQKMYKNFVRLVVDEDDISGFGHCFLVNVILYKDLWWDRIKYKVLSTIDRIFSK